MGGDAEHSIPQGRSRGGIGSLPAWVAGACLLTLLVRLPYAWAPLGIDEGGLAYVARDWANGGDVLYGDSWLDRSPVLLLVYRAALAIGTQLGSVELGIRTVGAIAACLVVIGAALVARRLWGDTAARYGSLGAGLVVSSPAIQGPFAYAELLAAVPSLASVWLLLVAVGSGAQRHASLLEPRRLLLLALSGAAAVIAVLVKQSSLDALGAAAGLAVAAIVLRPAATPRIRGRLARGLGPATAYAAGATAPIAMLGAWAELQAPGGAAGIWHALIGFRLDAAATLAGQEEDVAEGMTRLVATSLWSGVLLLVAGAVAACVVLARRSRARDGALLAGWLAAATVGILAGGSFWPHYAISWVPVAAVAAGVLVALRARGARHLVLAAGAVSVITFAVTTFGFAAAPHQSEARAVGQAVGALARADHTLYVLYGRANALYYSGLRSPVPYHWTLMPRSMPEARQAVRETFATPATQPHWVVEWQRPGAWGLDDGQLRATLEHDYRRVATVCGQPLLQRRDLSPPRDDEVRAVMRQVSCTSFESEFDRAVRRCVGGAAPTQPGAELAATVQRCADLSWWPERDPSGRLGLLPLGILGGAANDDEGERRDRRQRNAT